MPVLALGAVTQRRLGAGLSSGAVTQSRLGASFSFGAVTQLRLGSRFIFGAVTQSHLFASFNSSRNSSDDIASGTLLKWLLFRFKAANVFNFWIAGWIICNGP